MEHLLDIVFRSGAVYLFMIAALRLFGKKELTQLSITDLVLILLVSNAVQNSMVGPDSSLLGGVLAALTLFLLSFGFKYLTFRFAAVSKLVEGEPVLLVYKGVIKKDNLKKERITLEELEAVVREHGVSTATEAELVVLEKDGNISVLSDNIKGQSVHTRKRKPLHPKFRLSSN